MTAVQRNSMSKQNFDPIIQNQVDLLLFEEGSFSTLNWLLREGQLDYEDYQQWRKGQILHLEDNIKLSSVEIIANLKKVQDYAKALQLESEQQSYTSTDYQPLYFSSSAEKQRLFTTIYKPTSNRKQLDLFFDSAPACAESDAISAIAEARIKDIPGTLEKLKNFHPEKHQRFIQLLAFEKQIKTPKKSSKNKIKALLNEITPLAFDLLGRCTHDFITPLWHILSKEIKNQSFDSTSPQFHLSFTSFKGFQWKQVIHSIEKESNWHSQPILLFRYAEACFKLDKEGEGIAYWFSLFIQFPEEAQQSIKNTSNSILLLDWQSFLELDPELESNLFPAWMIMKKPALGKNPIMFEIACTVSMQLIRGLLCDTENEINEKAIHLRGKLKENSPILFEHYMRNNHET